MISKSTKSKRKALNSKFRFYSKNSASLNWTFNHQNNQNKNKSISKIFIKEDRRIHFTQILNSKNLISSMKR